MSHRDGDMTFVELIRDMNQRIKFLENDNAGTKRNNIRLGNIVVNTDDVANKICLQNLQSGDIHCFGYGDEDAVFSFSGTLPNVPSDVQYKSPPHVMTENQVAKEIALSLVDSHVNDIEVQITFKTFGRQGDTETGSTTIVCTLPAGKNVWITPIFVLCPRNSIIYVELTDYDESTDPTENLSVFVRFGKPSSLTQSKDAS